MKKYFLVLSCFFFSVSYTKAQIIPNGTIDNIDELAKKETIYIPMEDGTLLATDISIPVFQDSVVTELNIGGQTYTLQVIPKNTQYIIYDTNNISLTNYQLPIILSRTPYNKTSDDIGEKLFPFMGYAFANQDMRGRYESEGVYFPMYSDAWPKESYHPNIGIPMDLYTPTDPQYALKHHDGSQSVKYLANQAKRIGDINNDGIIDTILYSNGKIGLFGASAMGNSQYQALSDMPFTESNPIKCLLPIVATNEHYNTTLFHNGVFRNALVRGWITGQITDVKPSLDPIDGDPGNNIHSTSDYGYSDSMLLAHDLINWYVSDKFPSSAAGAFPNSLLRKDLDASQAPINAQGLSDNNGNLSRYKNLNQPGYHLTGWWDIFINGQIETFNRLKSTNPGVQQKLIIGPWTHQTIGQTKVGSVTYPSNVSDILNIDLDIDVSNILADSQIVNKIYTSEIMKWYRSHLGGEPYFIIPESHEWQAVGAGQVRLPSKNYIIPYYQFLNYLGGIGTLPQIPVELNVNGSFSTIQLDFPSIGSSLFHLSTPLSPFDTNYFNQTPDIRMYIAGPTEDPENIGVGNYWLGLNKFPLENGISQERFYFHQNQTLNQSAPTAPEGELQYIADPNNPVLTIGGNNMIPRLPDNSGDSQGQIDLNQPAWKTLTMDRNDVIHFETEPLADTFSVVGFPKAFIYAKGKTSQQNTTKTDFDIMVRILDVFPDGRELFVTEGVVNAKAREYSKYLSRGIDSLSIPFSNIDNDSYYYFEFQMLPLGYTFGKGHQIKVLLSSSNYPKYQSNPHLPNEEGEFFRWNPGNLAGYSYQGQTLQAQPAEITYSFDPTYPSYIEFPKLDTIFPSAIQPIESSKSSFQIHPNPAQKEITITWETPVSSSIFITDLNGRIVYQDQISKSEHSKRIYLPKLSAGLYLVQIPNLGKAQKLIIQ